MIPPIVDINLFVYNGVNTVAAAIDSVIAQTWPHWRMTLIDDGSTDGTADVLRTYEAADPRISRKRNRCNTGAVGAFQRGLWLGDADYVMPKSADDLIAPDFVERVLNVLLAHPACAMAHAAGLSFDGPGQVRFVYPPEQSLYAVGPDPVARAGAVMRTYTCSPAFWGIYRRDAVDRLAPIAYRAGWDHALLAELALYGEIRHVPEALYWRRGAGRPVGLLARAATAEVTRGLGLDDPISDPLWRAPCITTAFAHVKTFSIARVSPAQRRHLIADTQRIFFWRWGRLMQRELATLRTHIDSATVAAASYPDADRALINLQLTRLMTAARLALPTASLSPPIDSIIDLVTEDAPCHA